MTWIVLIPVKQAGARKSRLASSLSIEARDDIVERMLARVIGSIQAVPQTRTRIVSAAPLNAALEIERAAMGGSRLAVVHADLPNVDSDDIAALLDAADRCGMAIAPDRHGRGTNALAIADGRRFEFTFGEGSLTRHRGQAPDAASVERPGLAFDLDDAADLALLAETAIPG